jgi:hypothetical protein
MVFATVWMLVLDLTDDSGFLPGDAEGDGIAGIFYMAIPFLAVCIAGIPLARSFSLPHAAGLFISPASIALSALVSWFVAPAASALALSESDLDATFWLFVAIGWMAGFAFARLLWPPQCGVQHLWRVVLSTAGVACIAILWLSPWWMIFWWAVAWILIPAVAHLDVHTAE